MAAKVCVVGATGFIGRSAVQILHDKGFSVRATMRKHSHSVSLPAELLLSGVDVVQADVCEIDSIRRAVEGCQIVINCAGIYRWWMHPKYRKQYQLVNEDGAANVYMACQDSHVEHVLHISTAMAYGYPKNSPFNEDSEAGPHAAEYTKTKYNGDAAILKLHSEQIEGRDPFHLTILYLGCVTGPGDTFSVGRPSAVYRDFMLGKIPLLVGPDTKYIYVHIQDVQQAILAVCERKEGTKNNEEVRNGTDKYLIGNWKEKMTTRQYFELMTKHCGVDTPKMSLNLTVGYYLGWFLTFISTWITGTEPLMPIDIMRTALWGGIEYDCSKSERDLGLQYTPIDVAVREAIEDVRRRCSIDTKKA